MRMRLFAVAVIVLLATGAFAQDAAKSACDRTCLENYLDQYLDAMMAGDPNPELFTGDCKFTENGVQLPLGGEGLWYSMSGKGAYKFYVPDVETRQIAFIGTVREGAGLPQAKTAESAPGAEAPGLVHLPELVPVPAPVPDSASLPEAGSGLCSLPQPAVQQPDEAPD